MELYFISGMPRSGSTLLCQILNQNPNFYASPTSGLLEVMFNTRNVWDGYIEHKAMPKTENDARRKNVLLYTMAGYHSHVGKPVVFDKSRGWLAHIEMLEHVLGNKVKILCPVRDLREILSSFELLWRKQSAVSQIEQERHNYIQMQSIIGRCSLFMREDQPIGLAYNRVADAIFRGYRDRLHFVHYEDLTSNPEDTMVEIYKFLEKPHYQHDFNNVEQATFENDREHGIDNLHTVRPEVRPQLYRWPAILGPVGEQYKPPYPWTKQ